MGRQSCRPYKTRAGSSASSPCVSSSPSTRPSKVDKPTRVMWSLVRGSIFLYFWTVSASADFSSGASFLVTFRLPVAVFCLRLEAPPLKSSSLGLLTRACGLLENVVAVVGSIRPEALPKANPIVRRNNNDIDAADNLIVLRVFVREGIREYMKHFNSI